MPQINIAFVGGKKDLKDHLYSLSEKSNIEYILVDYDNSAPCEILRGVELHGYIVHRKVEFGIKLPEILSIIKSRLK